jgi:four helix bundle protein
MKTTTYDLEKRTETFSQKVIFLLREVPETTITRPIITQLIKSATSIGANYWEANGAESKKDFIHKVAISRKEARETKYWLNLLKSSVPKLKEKIEDCLKENNELILIFSSIVIKSKAKN